jgi:hypothetical protein
MRIPGPHGNNPFEEKLRTGRQDGKIGHGINEPLSKALEGKLLQAL